MIADGFHAWVPQAVAVCGTFIDRHGSRHMLLTLMWLALSTIQMSQLKSRCRQ